MTGKLAGKVAVITGGASGIGLASVRKFAAEGARICVADIDADAGHAAAAEVDGLFVRTDVSDAREVEALFDRSSDYFGGIDVLFNNAGISPQKDTSVLDTELDVWNEVLRINQTSVFLCCKYGIPHLIRRGSGCIINTASFVALMGSATSQIAYTASTTTACTFATGPFRQSG